MNNKYTLVVSLIVLSVLFLTAGHIFGIWTYAAPSGPIDGLRGRETSILEIVNGIPAIAFTIAGVISGIGAGIAVATMHIERW